MELAASDKQRILAWGDGLSVSPALRYATAGHAMDSSFKAFVDQLTAWVPAVTAKKDGDAVVTLPTLYPSDRMAYQAIPLDRELDPFLAVMADARTFVDRIDKDVRQHVARLGIPSLFKVFITPHCPHCPIAVATLLGLAGCSEQVRVTIVDGGLFPDAAERDRVTAAPTVILDDQFRWIGAVDAGELATLMQDRDPADLSADALRSMIEAGDAQAVAAMMGERGLLFDAFIDLLAHPRWSVRLGAMVAFEILAEENPELAGRVVHPLQSRFAKVDDAVKGDMLHVLGESGNPAALSFLIAAADDEPDDEVRAAAQEAIDKLQ